ncbi:MAG: hypothetical protein ACRDTN_13350, partial [Mycobacterium sp.]
SRVSIQSKVMMMLLVSSIVSVAVVGVIGYESGRSALRTAVSQRLTELGGSQTRAVEALFSDLGNSLIILSRDPTTVEAMQAFTAGFGQLANATITPAQQQAITNYYKNDVIKPTDRVAGDSSLDLALRDCPHAPMPRARTNTYRNRILNSRKGLP